MFHENSEHVNIDIALFQEQFEGKHYIFVDVREDDEYQEGHIPGTINIPLSELEDRYAEIAPELPVILVCAKGTRSAMAAEFLAQNGYEHIYNLEEGTMGWIMRGLPLEQS